MKNIYKVFRTTLEEKPNLYSFVIFVALLLVTVVTTYRVHGLTIAEEQKNAFFAGNALRNQIELTLNYGLSATQTIALLIEHGSLPSDFERVAEKMLRTYPVLDAIELGPDGVIRHVYPYEQNKKAVGFNILGDSIQQAEAAEAIKTQKLIFAGPLNLVQGGFGVVGRLPVFTSHHGEKRFWGFSLVVIKIDRLLTLAKSDELQSKGYHFQLRRFVSTRSAVDTFVNKQLSFADPMVLEFESMGVGTLISDGRLYIGERWSRELT